jgi:hypothetical protein
MRFSERQAAIKLLGYINKFITIDQLIEDGMLDTYLVGVRYLQKNFLNGKAYYESEDEIAILTALHNASPKELTLDELAGVVGFSRKSLAGKMFNLLSKAWAYAASEKIDKGKRQAVYGITVFGDEEYQRIMSEKIAKVQDS